MKIFVKRFDASLPLPEQKTNGAAGFDVSSRLDIVIKPHSLGYIPLNIALQVPEGYWTMLVARSSLHKTGLWLANGVGVIDSDYSGDNDEITAVVYNFSDQQVAIDKGTRVAQLIVQSAQQLEIEEVAKLNDVNRGGFGTTGK